MPTDAPVDAAAYHGLLDGLARRRTQTAVPIATAAFVVSALVFAPLSSYVAGRQARSPLVWFALGAAIGPLALVLLLLAPPGRCPDCGARVGGWPRSCSECGAPLHGAVGWRRGTAEPVERRPERPVVVRTVGTPGDDGAVILPRPVLVPTPRPDRSATATGADVPAAQLWTPTPRSTTTDTTGRRRRYRREVDMVGPDAQLLGSGIFLGGSAPGATNVARLEVGDRYGLARDGGELQILGPVTFDPERIVARVPLDGTAVELVADRLVVQGGPSSRGTVLAFAGLALSRRIDLAAALRAPTDEVAG
jgi:hypothetical protein